MAAHFLANDNSRCACGGPWPCKIAYNSVTLALGTSAGLSTGNRVPEEAPPYKYMIGQRAIYYGVIVTVCAAPEDFSNYDDYIWVDNPEKQYKHYVSISNLKPLPNGQL